MFASGFLATALAATAKGVVGERARVRGTTKRERKGGKRMHVT